MGLPLDPATPRRLATLIPASCLGFYIALLCAPHYVAQTCVQSARVDPGVAPATFQFNLTLVHSPQRESYLAATPMYRCVPLLGSLLELAGLFDLF